MLGTLLKPFVSVKDFFFLPGAAPPLLEWKPRQKGNQTAIVLVHGFSGDALSTWPHFGDLLKQSPNLNQWDVATLRYQSSLLPDVTGLWRSDAPIERLALMLKTACSHGELADYTNIAFVAHSMGGLLVQRALVDWPDLAGRTRHLFLFGTPSLGLMKAVPARRWKRQLSDMTCDGPFVTDLRAKWKALFGNTAPFHIFAIAGENDEFVPADSSLPPFAKHQQFSIPGDHLQIVKAEKMADPGVQLVIRGITGDAAPSGQWNAARVAVELGEFHSTIVAFGNPEKWPGLDPDAKVALALALESVDRGDEAFSLLANSAHESTDLMGTLAGRLKRRWLLHRQQDDAEKALNYYRTAYDNAGKLADLETREGQSYYHAINCAFMMLAWQKNRSAAEDWARKAVDHCSRAGDDRWKFATLGEANVILGDREAALAHYADALGRGATPRQIGIMYRQARKIAELLEQPATVRALDNLFRPAAEASAAAPPPAV